MTDTAQTPGMFMGMGVGRPTEKPGDPDVVFRMVKDFQGPHYDAMMERVLADADARRLLEDNGPFTALLADKERLRALPAGTLGHEYQAFADAEGLDIASFAATSEKHIRPDNFTDPRGFVLFQRMRDSHDLLHVIGGYGTDFVGEMGVLTFQTAQADERSPQINFFLRFARDWFKHEKRADALALMDDADERGQNAAYWPSVEWEALLETPLPDVRAQLHVPPPRAYEPYNPAWMAGIPMR